ncbi:MAG: 50S ribosomal protein L4 [candidate division WOR-3 bacterium]
MDKAPVYSPDGKRIGETALPAAVFGVESNPALLWEAVRMYLANRRQGNAQAKTRAEVIGSRRKIWRQKHTGRARHGDRYAPIFKGGGVAHGPRKRDYSYSLPRKALRKALAMSLSDRASEKRIVVVSPGFQMESPKTKDIWGFLKAAELSGKNTLIITSPGNRNLYLSGRNIDRVRVTDVNEANAYDVLWSEFLVLEEPCIKILEERLS